MCDLVAMTITRRLEVSFDSLSPFQDFKVYERQLIKHLQQVSATQDQVRCVNVGAFFETKVFLRIGKHVVQD